MREIKEQKGREKENKTERIVGEEREPRES